MIKKTRTILFILVLFLFLVSTPLIIFYSLGYRFDFENKKFFQTGAFSFKVWRPRGASVYVDNKLTKKTDFFGSVYVGNFLPKEYEIEIKKAGYLSWKKKLSVEEKWVTENKNIYLVPEKPQFDLLSKKITKFFVAPDGKKAVTYTIEANSWTLNLLDLNSSTFSPLFGEKELLGQEEKIDFVNLEWADDSRKILLEAKSEKNRYFVIEVAENPLLYSLNMLPDDIDEIDFLRDSQKIFFSQRSGQINALFSLDYRTGQVSDPIANNLLTFDVFFNELFWLGKEGYIHQTDLSGNIIRQPNKEAVEIDFDSDYRLSIFSEDKIFLEESDNLFFLDQDKQVLEKISDRIKGVKVSQDFKKAAYFTDNEIWVLFLEEMKEQPNHAKYDKIFLSRFSNEIGDVFWWTSHYLIFSVGDVIAISEIDNRDKINIYNFSEFKNPEIFWNNSDKKLYILSNSNLFSSVSLY